MSPTDLIDKLEAKCENIVEQSYEEITMMQMSPETRSIMNMYSDCVAYSARRGAERSETATFYLGES